MQHKGGKHALHPSWELLRRVNEFYVCLALVLRSSRACASNKAVHTLRVVTYCFRVHKTAHNSTCCFWQHLKNTHLVVWNCIASWVFRTIASGQQEPADLFSSGSVLTRSRATCSFVLSLSLSLFLLFSELKMNDSWNLTNQVLFRKVISHFRVMKSHW